MKKRKVAKSRTKEEQAYLFFKECLKADRTFTLQELADHAGWKIITPTTYLRKHWADILDKAGGDKLKVKPEFDRLSLEQFLAHGTQVRSHFTQYRRRKHEFVVQYEFLLPLTREDELRHALDDLFYHDTLVHRLKEIGVENLTGVIARREEESEEVYLDRLVKVISSKIGGYSISHVNGRFRASDIATRKEAGALLAARKPYLIDETTAVVRFIIPCSSGVTEYDDDLESIATALDRVVEQTEDLQGEVREVRWLFYHLFVEAVARTVGEQEIWLLEQSPYGRRLYVWERKK